VAVLVIFILVFIPIMFRPFDILKNFKGYLIGMMLYIFFYPAFSVLMQIFAICNLHDLSWGNRPSAAGAANVAVSKMVLE